MWDRRARAPQAWDASLNARDSDCHLYVEERSDGSQVCEPSHHDVYD